ncbi:MAG: WG repeat-containing protein, partial [Bacteroidales bacterium]|nr:WG repeat-containing protein [Bacteroidales bacterium]
MISFKKTRLLVGLFALSIFASAQDLKPVKDKDTKKFGYQDKKTKEWVIAPAYDKAGAFKDGVADVAVGSLYGIINEDGSWLFKPEYDKVGSFDKNG